MRIKKIEILGFRGALPLFEVPLSEKSACIYAENGFGKSTIADGLEYWSSENIETFHRAGCRFDAAIHVDAQEASITVHSSGSGPLRRKLSGAEPLPIEAVGSVADPDKAAGLPLLRHETVSKFMQKTTGDKKRELLELVGLAALNDFRDALRSAKTDAKRAREGAVDTEKTERRILDEKCGEHEVVVFAEQLRTEAKLPSQITGEDDLRQLDLSPPTQGKAPDSLGAVDVLARKLEEAAEGVLDPWNQLVADRAAVQRKALATLVREGQTVMSDWPQDTCPLCESDYPREQLSIELAERVAELAEIEERFKVAQEPLIAKILAWRALASVIETAMKQAPEAGWPNDDSLVAAETAVTAYAEQLEAASDGMIEAQSAPKLTLTTELKAMRNAATTAVKPETKALLLLSTLQQQLERVDKATESARKAKATEKTVKQLLKIADQRIETAINEAIDKLGELVCEYYLKLSGSQVYSEVKLAYEAKAAGGAEFSVLYDKRTISKPPQRVMSNGQLNGLALAFFLARTKTEDPHWRTIVFDDVVSSFGGAHRRGLLDLLDAEFSDWQVVLLTHDRTFALMAQERLTSGWTHKEISQWTPSGGPVLVEGSALNRLRKRLQEGHSATGLASIAREALEFELSKPLARLQYSVEYKPHGRYTGKEYLTALRKGLDEAESSLVQAPVLARMDADLFVTNLGSHYQPDLAGAETADYLRLADDLEEVRNLFTCDTCEEAVWVEGKSARKHNCRCKALAA